MKIEKEVQKYQHMNTVLFRPEKKEEPEVVESFDSFDFDNEKLDNRNQIQLTTSNTKSTSNIKLEPTMIASSIKLIDTSAKP